MLVTNIPQLPELTRRTNGFVDYLNKFGGNKTKVVDEEDFTIADIGRARKRRFGPC